MTIAPSTLSKQLQCISPIESEVPILQPLLGMYFIVHIEDGGVEAGNITSVFDDYCLLNLVEVFGMDEGDSFYQLYPLHKLHEEAFQLYKDRKAWEEAINKKLSVE